MARKITKIVLHHSITPRDLDFNKTLESINSTHRQRLYVDYGQLRSSTNYPDIAYHYCISGKGKVENTRLLEKTGYHASNYKVNEESIGICIIGDFDKETPSDEQYEACRVLILELVKKYGELTVHTHNEFKPSKTCPGKNFQLTKLLEMSPKTKQGYKLVEYAAKMLYNTEEDNGGNEDTLDFAKRVASECRAKLGEE